MKSGTGATQGEPVYADPYTRIAWLHEALDALEADRAALREALAELASAVETTGLVRWDGVSDARDRARAALAATAGEGV